MVEANATWNVLSDQILHQEEGGEVWEDAEDLLRHLTESPTPLELIVVRDPGPVLAVLGARQYSVPILPILLYGDLMVVGPELVPGNRPCGGCWAGRLFANLPTLAERCRRQHQLIPPDSDRLRAALDLARQLGRSLVDGSADQGAGWVVRLDRGTVERQRLVPDPRCDCCGELPVTKLEDLQGNVLGIIHSWGPPTGSRPPISVMTAMSRLLPGLEGAACGLDRESLRIRSLGECAERLGGIFGSVGGIRATAEGVGKVVPLPSMHLFSGEQYARSDFPYRRIEADTELVWLEGARFPGGERVFIPASLVTMDPRSGGSWIAPSSTTGLAAGPDFRSALESGVLEIVERDVATRAWYERRLMTLDPRRWAPAESGRLAHLGLEVRMLLAEDVRTPTPVVLVYVEREGAGVGAWGCAAGRTVREAAPHAVEEAVLMLVHRESYDTLLPRCAIWEGMPHESEGEVASRGVDWDVIGKVYEPIVVDLTHPVTRAVGVCVASCWSSRAVDFVRPDRPIPRAIWEPDIEVSRRIEETPSVFG